MPREKKCNTSLVFKCDSCGGDMIFSPKQQKLYCPYCDSTKDINRKSSHLRSYNPNVGEVTVDFDSYKCPNCNGMVELSPFETTKKCPFCGATNIVAMENLKGLKPDSILPFLVSKEEAAEKGKALIKSKILAPIKLKKSFNVENFTGIYFPNFGFNTKASSEYDGRFGRKVIKKSGSGKNATRVVEIKWYKVRGVRNDDFENQLVEACTQIKQEELKSILPYDMDNIEGFTEEYVSGFAAERYDTSLKDSFGIAKSEMDNVIRKRIIDKYHPDVIDFLNVSTTFSDIEYRYSLLPIWICLYKYKEKLYRFVVNGRTGKSNGQVPKSKAKIAFISILIALIIIAIILIKIFEQ